MFIRQRKLLLCIPILHSLDFPTCVIPDFPTNYVSRKSQSNAMDALINLIDSLVNVFWSLLDVVVSLVLVVLPWLPMLAWVGFWTFAVNWTKAFPILRKGGYIGVVLLMLVAVLVWGSVAPPIEGTHSLFGLTVSNFAGKFVYVTMLTCIALLCGSAQLSGAFGSLCEFPEEATDDDHGHGHGGHHGHDDHGHGHSHDTLVAHH
ncbi:MAG: hypothetical protein JNL58_13650 [Planctomyces sp.]|nr:hypothetical protein [Planctomyces sp.]